MKQSSINIHRRDFLKMSTLAAASVAIGIRAGVSGAQGAQVNESDPTAQSLGYKHDASKVDKAKFPKYAAGQSCSNCQLYQGKPGDAWGPCPIFGGKNVNAKGWCSAYVKKA
ncbi:MAG TPA: high-potential iron-sulfur protein [Burkholderiales bacterium]|nr:high-potential iron-sulfur protein [Burkholderiales bacterium]